MICMAQPKRTGPFQGTWVAQGPSTNSNAICFQVWSCNTGPQLIAPNQHVVIPTTEAQTTGACFVGTGDPSSCENCTASGTPPSTPCNYFIDTDPSQ
jgi:hypothetical protein